MGIKNFAFVVGEDVFTVFSLDENMEGAEPMIAGLRSKPVIIETETKGISIGWKYIDGEFWAPAAPQEGPGYELDD
jgi:hypothetical protein